eukprot:gene25820-31182_t
MVMVVAMLQRSLDLFLPFIVVHSMGMLVFVLMHVDLMGCLMALAMDMVVVVVVLAFPVMVALGVDVVMSSVMCVVVVMSSVMCVVVVMAVLAIVRVAMGMVMALAPLLRRLVGLSADASLAGFQQLK